MINYISKGCVPQAYWVNTGKNEILALILAFGGTVLLATHGNLTQLSVSKTTLIFGLSSAVATIFYNLVPGNLMDIYGTFPMVGWGMLISGIGLTPFVRPWTLVEDITWDWQCIGCIVVVIIFGTVMSFSCYMEGVRLIGGSKASLLASRKAGASRIRPRSWHCCYLRPWHRLPVSLESLPV